MPRKDILTRVDCFGDWFAKRDDLAAYTGPEFPAGSKVRQYLRMAKTTPGAPMVVGCSADSAMQIYVAAAAYQTNVKGIVFTAGRAEPTDATQYAQRWGADLREVRPGYLSVIRNRARAYGKELGQVVRWDVAGALRDAAEQTANLPDEVRRIIIPTGSGLTAAGVMAGMAERGHKASVVVAAVSDMADVENIEASASKLTTKQLPSLHLIRAPYEYGQWLARRLPDGTPLDPFYAAKALDYIQPGDCLWLPGLRPVEAFPAKCRAALGL